MQRLLRVITLVLVSAATAGAEDLAARVVLLANRDDADSVRVARHYAARRGVPVENIIALPMPGTETITWPEFVTLIWSPLQQELTRLKWIDAMAMQLVDGVGRTKVAASGHRLSYLVVCRGVPLRIMHDPALYAPALPFTHRSAFRTNAGSVDSELGLLANPNYSINAFVPNPLHRNDAPSRFEAGQVVKVARLDGPSVEDALALVDRAIAAEARGPTGRAYVDIGGNSPDGDRWLESAVGQLREAGLDLQVDRASSTIPATARFDAPLIYLGWYEGEVNGPFKLPGFRFPPGAIALHIHSYSAQTLRSADANWCGPFIARGVTATVGNVFEPYLQLTHRPDLLVRALLRGETFGDAVCYAQPVLSWQTVAIGDPLYRPFGAVAQKPIEGERENGFAAHAFVRQLLALEAAGKNEEAMDFARNAHRDHPSFVLGMALAERLRAAGDKAAAAAILAEVPPRASYRTDEWALVREAAGWVADGGREDAAVELYQSLFKTGALPPELQIAWLPDAINAAHRARDAKQANAWRAMLRGLSEAPLALPAPLAPAR